MKEISLVRLYILRAMYLFIVVGLGVYVWPGIFHRDRPWGLLEGQTTCMLAAFSLLCALGLRYPVQMLPILLWELLWKTLWLLLVPLPQWKAGHVEESIKPAIFAISLVALVYLAVPWPYIVQQYARGAGERWRRRDN